MRHTTYHRITVKVWIGVNHTADYASLIRPTSYDALRRLDAANDSVFDQGFDYDKNGNRRQLTDNSVTTDLLYAPGSNRLSKVGTATYQLDANGNTTSDGSHTYYYDTHNRLSLVDRSTAAYRYNALGQRVSKSDGQSIRHFVYGINGRLLGEYEPDGKLIQEYIYLNDQPVALVDQSGKVYYIHTDHIGTPRRVSDPSTNTVLWSWDSDPFGRTAANDDVDGDGVAFEMNLRFAGQYYDQETGLHYNYFRYYDPKTGRYITSDPIGLGGGRNTYSYALGNPMRWYDSKGLAPSCNGEWSRQGWNRMVPFISRKCICYWLCMDCENATAWSGVKESLPSTIGEIIFDPNERGPDAGDVEQGNQCLCTRKPGPEKGCDDCP